MPHFKLSYPQAHIYILWFDSCFSYSKKGSVYSFLFFFLVHVIWFCLIFHVDVRFFSFQMNCFSLCGILSMFVAELSNFGSISIVTIIKFTAFQSQVTRYFLKVLFLMLLYVHLPWSSSYKWLPHSHTHTHTHTHTGGGSVMGLLHVLFSCRFLPHLAIMGHQPSNQLYTRDNPTQV